MFGPFATFSPKFLKNGSMLDIVTQVRPHNLLPMLQVAVKNPDLITYLVSELLKNHAKKVDSLRTFMPTAKDEDWTLIDAGQRAQVMKKDPKKGGILQFGTRSSPRPTGRSPVCWAPLPVPRPPSRSCSICSRSASPRVPGLEPELRALIPTFGEKLNEDAALAEKSTEATAAALGINV